MQNRKRRAKGSGTIRLRKDGRWEGRYKTGIDPATGKPILKCILGATEREVQAKLIDIISEINKGEYIEPSKMYINDWMDIWIEEYSSDKKYSTLRGYKATIRNHIKPALGNVKIKDLDTQTVQRFYNQLQEPDSEGKVLTPKTIKNIHMVLNAAMNQAVQNGMIKKNPCVGTKIPRVYKPKIKTLTDDEISQFLTEADKHGIYGLALKVILFTGMREAECAGLTWDCVDFRNGSITVEKQLMYRAVKDNGAYLVSPKSGKMRVINPAPFVMDLLHQRYLEQIEQAKYAGSCWMGWKNEAEHKTAFVFTNELGEYVRSKRIYLHFKSIAAVIGTQAKRVHDLRHTFAVLSIQNGDDIKTVQENLGHSTAAFTLDVYGHVSDRMRKESANRMQNFVSNLPKNES